MPDKGTMPEMEKSEPGELAPASLPQPDYLNNE